jgi:glycolate oxidase
LLYVSINSFQCQTARCHKCFKAGSYRTIKQIVGAENVLIEPEKVEPYGADAVKEKFPPEAVVFPETTEQMSQILRLANEYTFPVTARGGGVGYTGGAVPVEGGIVIGTDKMNRNIEVSQMIYMSICQARIDDLRIQQDGRKSRVAFPARPGELQRFFYRRQHRENAGGMRTPKYGVTKHSVLGLEIVTRPAKLSEPAERP